MEVTAPRTCSVPGWQVASPLILTICPTLNFISIPLLVGPLRRRTLVQILSFQPRVRAEQLGRVAVQRYARHFRHVVALLEQPRDRLAPVVMHAQILEEARMLRSELCLHQRVPGAAGLREER